MMRLALGLALLGVICINLGCAWMARGIEGAKVKTGLDMLEQEDFARLKGRKVGLITNHSALNNQGEHILEMMLKSDNVEIVALFAPEHGFKGMVDASIADQMEKKSGLPIYSLYGQTYRPTKEMLKGVDLLIFDIQDIGERFYTYISTMAMCMEEAKKNEIKFMVLDRPNPITGLRVEGPIQDEELYGRFTSYFPMPMVHGMTIGELAKMFNEYFGIQCELEVVKMEGWRRDMYFDDTGLPWVNPSPNIRSVKQAILYPGIALTEGTNMSVGRGTDIPFEIVGAPWINSVELIAEMNARGTPGLRLEPVSFVPDTSRYAGEKCHGFEIKITDRKQLQMVRTGISLIQALYQLYPDKYNIDDAYGLVGSKQVLEMIKQGDAIDKIIASWQQDLQEFINRRQNCLLYLR